MFIDPNLSNMAKITNQNPVSKLICSILGHNYEVTKQVTSHVKEYTCKCCKKQLTTDSNGKLTELTPKYKEINSILERIHSRRLIRLQQISIASSIY